MIMKRLHICLFGILAILSSCAKTADVPLNEQKRQYLEDWIKRYPDAKKENGCYILEDIPGDGAEYDASGSGYVFVNTIVRRLDGTVLSNSDEQKKNRICDFFYKFGQNITSCTNTKE